MTLHDLLNTQKRYSYQYQLVWQKRWKTIGLQLRICFWILSQLYYVEEFDWHNGKVKYLSVHQDSLGIIHSLVTILDPLGGAFVVAGLPEGIASSLEELIIAVVGHFLWIPININQSHTTGLSAIIVKYEFCYVNRHCRHKQLPHSSNNKKLFVYTQTCIFVVFG